ncbi:hypothetical protein DFP72DRAFT_899285 [Ephemerocybe angulata]|uniref:SH3 domain-containing protein n=1 Tax=Ephemerocybe angulata TaxID=980116 RepID=A0A8H6HX45_9AGAR|nr:hypothetical protein DFP72DRAFT_899285 [Tulosesus angulatus]
MKTTRYVSTPISMHCGIALTGRLLEKSDDLSFRAGDTIEVIEETSAEWWTGRCRGREGLFPSNYVERLTRTPSPLPPPAPRNNSIRSSYHDYGYDQRGPSPSFPTPDQSSPYSAAPSFHQSPYPPMAQGYPGPSYYTPPQHQAYGYGGPPPSTPIPGPSTSQPQQPEQPPKKHKLGGKLGSTLAHSAAGGVGFGAGSAIGSGIIHSIF